MGKYPMQQTIQGIDRDHRNFSKDGSEPGREPLGKFRTLQLNRCLNVSTMFWLLVDTLLFNLSQVRDPISDDCYL